MPANQDYFAKSRMYTKGAMKARKAQREASDMGLGLRARVADKVAKDLGKKAAKAQKKARK